MFLLGNNIVLRNDNKNIINLIKKNKYIYNLSLLFNNNFLSNYYLKNNLFFFNHKLDINIDINIFYLNLSVILYQELNMFNNIHNIEVISQNDIIYFLGIDNFKLKRKSKFHIFQGHHINLEYLYMDLIFPNINFFEKSSNYLNVEGNSLQTNFILYPPVFCRNDWSILNAIYIYIINFIYKIYEISNFHKINYLNINRFYFLFNNLKKSFFF